MPLPVEYDDDKGSGDDVGPKFPVTALTARILTLLSLIVSVVVLKTNDQSFDNGFVLTYKDFRSYNILHAKEEASDYKLWLPKVQFLRRQGDGSAAGNGVWSSVWGDNGHQEVRRGQYTKVAGFSYSDLCPHNIPSCGMHCLCDFFCPFITSASTLADPKFINFHGLKRSPED
ncbi:UNVERIFIED_CONTAM: hypothetical protein Sangu_1757400 [Sesamum angustifolium]|uniref:Uncharacterized protein n=1 Tax=Sesamum angustifolium TaxID=2727405 RepID=A0AAW2M5J7_9LAMI